MSAGINRRIKPLQMRRMIMVAAFVAALAFGSVFVVWNFMIHKS